jgi:hypothetical protein
LNAGTSDQELQALVGTGLSSLATALGPPLTW